MDFSWLEWSNPVAFWWVFLSSVSVFNIVVWMWTRAYIKRRYGGFDRLRFAVVACSAAYVFGCAFRSFIPRADVQRITLFDTWLASVFVGRTVATIAEVAFVAQWALILNFIARETGSRSAALIGAWIVPIILVAETCSWYAVVTTSYIGNVIEESLWATTYSLIAVALVSLFLRFKDVAKYAIGVAIVGCAIYVGFMATVDVPMYFNRWQQDVVAAKESLGLWSGLVDLNTRWLVTHEISEWKEEIPWMSLYFSVAVWVSLLLCYVPMTKEHLRHHLKI